MSDPAKYLGFFDYPDQEEPTYDPPHDGPCIVCEQPLTAPMKTISLQSVDDELPRSFFYRAHKICYEESSELADERAFLMIEDGKEPRNNGKV